MRKMILMLRTHPLSDVWHFFVGWYRYRIYYLQGIPSIRWVEKIVHSLMRTYIREQIEYRISVMDKQCYDEGQCKICGCTTTALQMANKSCDKPCYPTMMSKKDWSRFKNGGIFHDAKNKTYWQKSLNIDLDKLKQDEILSN